MSDETLTYYMQLPLLLHENKIAIAETKFEVPRGYSIERDMFVLLPDIDAPMRIIVVFYDAIRGEFVCMPDSGSEDATRNMDDWLAMHPHWYKASRPIAKPVDGGLVCGNPACTTCGMSVDDEIYDDSEDARYDATDEGFDNEFDDEGYDDFDMDMFSDDDPRAK